MAKFAFLPLLIIAMIALSPPAYGAVDDLFVSDVIIAEDSCIYVTGGIRGTCDLLPGPEIKEYTTANGLYNSYLIKLNSDLSFSWSNVYDYLSNERTLFISLGDDGTLYLIGVYDNEMNDHNLTLSQESRALGIYDGIFVRKLDNNGNLLWLKSFDLNPYNSVYDVVSDNDGNIYIATNYDQNYLFQTLTGPVEVSGAGTILLKLDTNGDVVWIRRTEAGIRSLSIDENNSVYIAGTTNREFYLFPGDIQNPTINNLNKKIAFLININQDGQIQWAKTLNDEDDNICHQTIVQNDGSIILGGYSHHDGLYIVQYDTTGEFVKYTSWGKSGPFNFECLLTDAIGNIYFLSSGTGIFDFDPSETVISNPNADTPGNLGPIVINGQTLVGVVHFPNIFITGLTYNHEFLWFKELGNRPFDSTTTFVLSQFTNEIIIVGTVSNDIVLHGLDFTGNMTFVDDRYMEHLEPDKY